jgi:hypothetical protein
MPLLYPVQYAPKIVDVTLLSQTAQTPDTTVVSSDWYGIHALRSLTFYLEHTGDSSIAGEVLAVRILFSLDGTNFFEWAVLGWIGPQTVTMRQAIQAHWGQVIGAGGTPFIQNTDFTTPGTNGVGFENWGSFTGDFFPFGTLRCQGVAIGAGFSPTYSVKLLGVLT